MKLRRFLKTFTLLNMSVSLKISDFLIHNRLSLVVSLLKIKLTKIKKFNLLNKQESLHQVLHPKTSRYTYH